MLRTCLWLLFQTKRRRYCAVRPYREPACLCIVKHSHWSFGSVFRFGVFNLQLRKIYLLIYEREIFLSIFFSQSFSLNSIDHNYGRIFYTMKIILNCFRVLTIERLDHFMGPRKKKCVFLCVKMFGGSPQSIVRNAIQNFLSPIDIACR